MARERGFFTHFADCIQVYTGLAPEALGKKQELKEILAALREANVRHRWATPIKIQVFYKGKTYFIRNYSEEYDILQHLGIPTPMSIEKIST